VVGSAAAVPATARARVSLRVPPGTGPGAAREALTNHLTDAAPWGARVSVETEGTGSPFRAATDGAAYTALGTAMKQVYGKPLAFLGQGGWPVLGSRWWQWSSSRRASCWRAGSGAPW
jgi:acetylornithine deacetylase/succinyl-diaminopimelate desuccinylase-like protein